MRVRQPDENDLVEAHEINVSPFIDVMLVLLIIFMVAAPLATVDVDVDLPGSTAAAQPRPERPVFVTVRGDLSLAVASATVDRASLPSSVDRLTDGNRESRIYLRADRTVAYGDLMEVMNLLRAAGYRRIALVGLDLAPPSDAAAP